MTKPVFTEEEVELILERLESGDALTHEIARDYPGCSPADIWRLWDERNRSR